MADVDEESLLMVADLWRRRVEWLWSMCEATSGKPVDIEWLDEQIIKDEANDARQAPKG